MQPLHAEVYTKCTTNSHTAAVLVVISDKVLTRCSIIVLLCLSYEIVSVLSFFPLGGKMVVVVLLIQYVPV
jgi:hypothetical protein